MYKIDIIGYSLVITNTATGKEVFEHPAGDTKFNVIDTDEEDKSIVFSSITGSFNLPLGSNGYKITYKFSEIEKTEGIGDADFNTFKTVLRGSIGGFKGVGTDPVDESFLGPELATSFSGEKNLDNVLYQQGEDSSSLVLEANILTFSPTVVYGLVCQNIDIEQGKRYLIELNTGVISGENTSFLLRVKNNNRNYSISSNGYCRFYHYATATETTQVGIVSNNQAVKSIDIFNLSVREKI